MPAGTNVASGSLVSPGGQQGIPGPNAVSTDAGNQATFGSDSRIYVPDPTPVITSVRLRSFNAIGNPTFEVDQRNVGTALTNSANGTFIQDRWQIIKSGSLTGAVNTALQDASSAPVLLPGTNFGITSKYQRFTVGTAQASLAAADYYFLRQAIESPQWRELSMDVHSFSLLVRSSVAGLKFSVSLQDNGNTHSLIKSAIITASNTWTLLQLPALPVWVGTFSAAPGQSGYLLNIALACGTNQLAAPNTAWQTGNLIGETGMSNFLATAGATFDIAYVSHVPGANCLTIDCPFGVNLDGPMGCLRYYCKSYDYGTLPGTANMGNGLQYCALPANHIPNIPIQFKKLMATQPTVAGYAYDGTINTVRDVTGGVNRGIVAVNFPSASSFCGFNISALNSAGWDCQFHYTADTGW